MPSVKVGSPNHSISFLRYSYPIILKLDNGDEVSLQRFYSDVMLLRTGLVVKSQRANVPPLPEKAFDGWLRVREQRRVAFEYFLNWCVMNAPADSLVLDFFQVKSLTCIGDHVEVELSRKFVPNRPEQQAFVKFIFFAFLWMLAWRAMLPQDPSVPGESNNSTLKAQEFVDFLVNPPADAATFEKIDILASKLEEIVIKTVHEEFIEFVGEEHFRVFTKEEQVVFIDANENDVVESKIVETQTIEDENESETVSHAEASSQQEETLLAVVPPALSVEVEIEAENIQNDDSKVNDEHVASDKYSSLEKASKDEPARVQNIEQASIDVELRATQETEATADEEQGDIQAEFESYVRDKTNRIEVEVETTPPQIEFFFTPFHGVVGFLALYVIVLIWSRFVPSDTSLATASDDETSSTSPHAISSFSNDGGVVASSTDTSINENSRISNSGDSSSFASLSFEEARMIFDRLEDFNALNENESNLARALQFRALNVEPKGVQVLTRFWEEACALTCEQAKDRFVAFISSRFISTKARRRFLEQPSFSQLAQDVSDDNSSIASNGSAMAVFIKPPPNSNGSSSGEGTPTHNGEGSKAVSWWDTSREQIFPNSNNVSTPMITPIKQQQQHHHQQGNGELSFIKQEQPSSILTSFDSTDISSLSISPSPVRAAVSASDRQQESNHVTGASLIALKAREDADEDRERAKNKHQEFAELVVGTVVGIAGVAFVGQLVRAVRTRRF